MTLKENITLIFANIRTACGSEELFTKFMQSLAIAQAPYDGRDTLLVDSMVKMQNLLLRSDMLCDETPTLQRVFTAYKLFFSDFNPEGANMRQHFATLYDVDIADVPCDAKMEECMFYRNILLQKAMMQESLRRVSNGSESVIEKARLQLDLVELVTQLCNLNYRSVLAIVDCFNIFNKENGTKLSPTEYLEFSLTTKVTFTKDGIKFLEEA